MVTLDRIRAVYSNTFFCQVGKWGYTLSESEAQSLGLLPVTKSSDSKVISNKDNKDNKDNSKASNKATKTTKAKTTKKQL